MDSTNDKVRIANLACIKMGCKTITSLDDGSLAATVINLIYDFCLQAVLEEHPWSFATSTVSLAQLAVTPVDFGDNLSIAYALPVNFLSIYLKNYPYAVIKQGNISGQNVLLSDTVGLKIKYIFKNTDPTTYTAKFTEALASKIAYTACFKISEAEQNASKLKAEYTTDLLSAMAEDSKGSSPDEPQQDEWFIAMLAGSGATMVSANGQIGFGI